MKAERLHETPEVKRKTIKIGMFAPLMGDIDDDRVGLGYTKYACNLRIFDGEIYATSGVGVAYVNNALLPGTGTIGSVIKDAVVYKRFDYTLSSPDYRVVYRCSNGKIYEARIGVDTSVTRINVSESTSLELLNYHYNNKDGILVFDSEVGKIHFYDGTNIQTESAPKIVLPCVYNGKVYGVENAGVNRIRCSARNDPFDWTTTANGAGQIVFPDEGGVLQRLLPCGENLYIFRDYAVYKLTGYTDLNEYSMTRIFLSGHKIYGKTAAIWNGKIYFATDEGFFSIDGSRVSSEWRQEFTMVDSLSNASGECHNGVYYLAAWLKTDGGDAVGEETSCRYNNGILGMMIGTGGGVDIVRGLDVKRFLPCSLNGKSYLFLINSPGLRCMNLYMFTDNGKLFGEPLEKRWTSPVSSFGTLQYDKTLRAFHVRSKRDMTVKLIIDGVEYDYAVTGNAGITTIPINRRGQTIQVKFSSKADFFALGGFEIEYELTERRKYGAN